MRPRAADLDSVPVGVLQMAGAEENFHLWFEKSENNRHGKSILWHQDGQEK